MKYLLVLGIFALLAISSCKADDLTVGNNINTKLVFKQNAKYDAWPFVKRVKELFYTDPDQKIIKAVIAKDNDHSGATAIITAGGVGSSYVNLRFKSLKGEGINYDVEVYV